MDFEDQLKSLKSAWGLVMAACAAGPLALWMSDLQPPSPSGSAVVATTACAVAIWLAFGLKSVVRRPATLKLFGVACFVLGLLLEALYFSAFYQFVVSFEVEGHARTLPVVVGYELQPGVQMGNKSAREALMDNLGHAEQIWTEQSIRHANEILLGSFVGSFFFITMGSAIVTLGRRR